MDAKTIDQLSTFDPSSTAPRIPTGQLFLQKSPLYEDGAVRFINKYLKTEFGWYIATQMANYGERFRVPLYGRDFWVFLAYLMHVDPEAHYNPHIAEAFHIHRGTGGLTSLSAAIKSMLLSSPLFTKNHTVEGHLRAVANQTGVEYKTIEAYEILFYNVLDRQEDRLYLANAVYPNTRLIELSADYFKNAPLYEILLRAGYNRHDIDLSAYLAGLGNGSYIDRLAGLPDRESQLTNQIMGNGILLTLTNMLNQTSIGVGRSTTLLAASRQGGSAAIEIPMDTVSASFSQELTLAMSKNSGNTARMLREDAATTLEAEIMPG